MKRKGVRKRCWDYKKGTTEVGKLSETTLQMNRAPCHLGSLSSLTQNVCLLCPSYHVCLTLGLVGMGKVQCEIVFCIFSGGKCPASFCVLSDGNYQSEGLSVILLRENECEWWWMKGGVWGMCTWRVRRWPCVTVTCGFIWPGLYPDSYRTGGKWMLSLIKEHLLKEA